MYQQVFAVYIALDVMSRLRFLLFSLLIFAVIGPLVPMTVAGIQGAFSSGDASKLLAPIVLAIPSYFVGLPLALIYGAASAALFLLFAVLIPVLPHRNQLVRLAIALLVSSAVLIGIGLSFGNLLESIHSARSYSQQSQERLATAALSLLRLQSTSLMTFGLPTLVCNVIISLAVWPRLGVPRAA